MAKHVLDNHIRYGSNVPQPLTRVFRKDDGTEYNGHPVDCKELLATGEWLSEDDFRATQQGNAAA
jgi:hypothetical protein